MSPITTAASEAALLRWLASPAGEQALADAALLPADTLVRVTRLRRHHSPERAAALVEQLDLRERARGKFPGKRLLLTRSGLEQSTGELIAAYRALRFPAGILVLDACSGIGGDSLALARRGPLLAVDQSEAACVCARYNAVAAGVSEARVLCADVTGLDLGRLGESGVGAAFFDPSRRGEGRARRMRDAEEYLPPLSWFGKLQSVFPAAAAKVSPAIDDETLQQVDADVEFVSARGECREALLWSGDLRRPAGRSGYRAVILGSGGPPVSVEPFDCDVPPLGSPEGWLCEPDPALIRAHLLDEVCTLLGARPIERGIAYLSTEECRPSPLAVCYRIIEAMPFRVKSVQARCRALGGRVVAIKKRGVDVDPAALRKPLCGDPEGARRLVVVLMARAEKIIAMICEAPERSQEFV